MIDRILEERYELLELIGSGGMADVYRARDQLLDRPVAVKILHAQFKNDTEFIGKFHREAQAAARLSHPHI
ncbi:MAG: serine/threonine protein kinase, partial [Selenomonadaceae bacterium]|nr:serine/threonine protein kinase [Selenomonadaceae bacterium]